MRRTIFVALCAVALFVMAPFALTDDAQKEFVPPPNGVTDLYQAMTPNGTSPDMTKEELAALAEKCFAGEPEKASRVMDDGVHEYWTYIWNAKGREDECHVTLVVTLVKDKVTGTMYVAKKGDNGRTETKTNESAKTDRSTPEAPHSQLDDAFAKLKKGMTEAEALETLKSCGVDWKPTQILSYTIDLDDGNEKTRQVLCKDMHWGAQYPSVVPDTPDATNYPNQHDYLLELHLHFADGKLYDADRMDWYKTRWNMLWRPPKNEEKK